MGARHATELLIPLQRGDEGEGLTRQIYSHLRAAILNGRLRSGDRLPPSRALAKELDVARLTVATAYDWLRAEGYVYGKVGAGTFVAPVFEAYVSPPVPPIAVQTVAKPRFAKTNGQEQSAITPPVPLSAWARRIASIPLLGAGSGESAPFDLRPGVGAAETFPWARWRRVVGWQDPVDPLAEQRRRQRESAARAGQWDALLGPIETRDAIAAWLRRSRAVRCEPDQVLIAGSVQQVLALLARLLVEPGESGICSSRIPAISASTPRSWPRARRSSASRWMSRGYAWMRCRNLVAVSGCSATWWRAWRLSRRRTSIRPASHSRWSGAWRSWSGHDTRGSCSSRMTTTATYAWKASRSKPCAGWTTATR